MDTSGNFGEHFLDFIDLFGTDKNDLKNTPHGYQDCLDRGTDASGNTGLTIMASYMPQIAAAYFGEELVPSHSWRRDISVRYILSLKKYSDSFGIVLLTRNIITLAISNYFASRTGKYHILNDQEIFHPNASTEVSQKDVLATLDPREILRVAKQKLAEYQFLEEVVQLVDTPVTRITYEEITRNPDDVKRALLELGFPSDASKKILVQTKKVVRNDITQAAGEIIAEYIGKPNWTWESMANYVSTIEYDIEEFHNLQNELGRARAKNIENQNLLSELNQARSELNQARSELNQARSELREMRRVVRYPWKYLGRFASRE